MGCDADTNMHLRVFGRSFCRLLLSVLVTFLLLVLALDQAVAAPGTANSVQSSPASKPALPDDAGFKYKWSDSREIGMGSHLQNAKGERTDAIGFRLAIPQFWQGKLLEEENGCSVFFTGSDTTAAEDPPVKFLLGVYMGVKEDYSELDAMTATYRDKSIASQTLLYSFKDSVKGHAYEHYQVRYPNQQSGKLVDEFAFFIETKRLMYRFSFITPSSQSERIELFVWSIFNSLRLYDEALK